MVAQNPIDSRGLIEKNTRFLRYRKLRLSEGRIRTGEQCDAERTFFALRQPNRKPKRQNTDLHNLPCLQGCLCPECLVWEDWSSRRQSIPWRIACPLILQHPRRLFSKRLTPSVRRNWTRFLMESSNSTLKARSSDITPTKRGFLVSPGRRLWERISLSRSRPVLTCRNSTDVSVRGSQPASCTALSATTDGRQSYLPSNDN